jgi:hypothetical protein
MQNNYIHFFFPALGKHQSYKRIFPSFYITEKNKINVLKTVDESINAFIQQK